jgi:hypothetical protein
MSEEPVASLVSDFFRTRAEHPFGDLEYMSGRTRAPFSRALLATADNLLAKADRLSPMAIRTEPATSSTVLRRWTMTRTSRPPQPPSPQR